MKQKNVRLIDALNFVERFSKNSEILNFTKIRPVGAQSFHADIWIDMTKLIVACGNFTNAPRSMQTIIRF